MCHNRDEIIDNIIEIIVLITWSVSCVYGVHIGWMVYALAIPWYIFAASLIDYVVNGNNNADDYRVTSARSTACIYIMFNTILILFDHSTSFIIGRIIGIAGACLLIIRCNYLPTKTKQK